MVKSLTLLVLVVALQWRSSETARDPQREKTEGSRNRSTESQYLLRSLVDEKMTSRSPHVEGRHSFQKDKISFPNRDYYRRNLEDKKPTGKWTVKDDDYIRKANREALIGKTGDRGPRRDGNFDTYNMKNLNHREQSEEKTTMPTTPGVDSFRNDESHPSQRHPSTEDTEEYLSTNRVKKMKKHGSGGFIPFPPPRERKPNIILILTDDQDVELGSLNFMPKTLRLLRDGGAEFRHAYVTTPMCCPSRSSLLTGMYVHNHNVFTNNENCSNVQWQQTHETRTFATYLSNAGYRTGYFGKYLNKYNGSYIPPGWREWGGLIMNSRYYNYSINLNGKKIKHGFDYHKDYYPDLIANDSISFLRQSKNFFSRKPVMLVVSFPAPHGPEDSAPQYSKMFFNITTHHTPAYDFAPNPDKQWILQVTNKMQDIHKQFTDVLMTKRLQTLQSVDSAVERIYQELKNIGELENTYIIYTSDHGYHLGQFGLVKGKSFPFEFDVRVPFLVRGPGIEPGTVVDDIVLNIDLAPTFLDLAGVESPLHMDGRSIARLLHHRPSKRRRIKWPDTFLIESSGRREIPGEIPRARVEKLKPKEGRVFRGKDIATEMPEIVTQDSTETRQLEETENQQLAGGSNAESSETDTPDDVEEEELSEEENSSVIFPQNLSYRGIPIPANADTQVDNKIPQIAQPMTHAVSKLARLALECQSPDMQSPCRPGQKWYCIADGDRWRKYKCKLQRKCICFTPEEFLYTKVFNEDRLGGPRMNFGGEERRSRFVDRFRGKRRSNDLWSLVPENVDYSTVASLMTRSSKLKRRKKRDVTEDHIADVLDDLKQELYEAEETVSSLNSTISLGTEPNISRCSVTSSGKVNCSSLVYSDFKVWKKSRDEIEARIKSLKAELEALKEIRKHLKEKRPEPVTTTEGFSFLTNLTSPSTVEVTDEARNDSYSDNLTTENFSESYDEENRTVFSISTKKYYIEPEETKMDFSTTPPEVFSNYSTVGLEDVTTTKKPTQDVAYRPKSQSKAKNNEDGSVNRIHGVTAFNRGREKCICRPDDQDIIAKKEEKELAKEAKRKLKEERLRKKERRLKKKAKLEKECLSEKMNCFIHDNEHWRTPPFWTEGPFCFCMNANNNTYSCLRTINATHNFLYCEFTTGFKTFYNLRIDPFEQLNRFSTLTPDESRFLSNQLAELKACKGTKECSAGSGRENLNYNSHHHHHQHHTYNIRVKRELIY